MTRAAWLRPPQAAPCYKEKEDWAGETSVHPYLHTGLHHLSLGPLLEMEGLVSSVLFSSAIFIVMMTSYSPAVVGLSPFSSNISSSSFESYGPAVAEAALLCQGRPDDYAAAQVGFKCRRYYRCNRQQGVSIYLCPGKQVFNGHRCVSPSEHVCDDNQVIVNTPSNEGVDVNHYAIKDCEGQSDGYYQDAESGCRSYFYCVSGLKAVYVCPSKRVFDGHQCVEPASYQCPFVNVNDSSSASCMDAIRSNPEGSYVADLSTGCRSYYFCSGDGVKLITLNCSGDKIFNGKKCVDSAQYRCPASAAEGNQPSLPESYYTYIPLISDSGKDNNEELLDSESPPVEHLFVSSRSNGPIGDQTDCPESNGFFPVKGSNCRRYYFCVGGTRTDLNCSADTVFNGELCVSPDHYTCPECPTCNNHNVTDDEMTAGRSVGRRESSCSGASRSGLYPAAGDDGTNCRGYVYCRHGKQQGPVVQCSPSERFSSDHSRCLPKHQVPCPPLDGVDVPFPSY